MTTQAEDWTHVGSMRPLTEAAKWQLARTEYARTLTLFRSLEGKDWSPPTDCSAWKVRDVLGHLVGAAEGFSRPLELVHQYLAGMRYIRQGRTDGTQPVDGANAVQVSERANVPIPDLLARYERVVAPILRWRARLRHLPVHMDDVGGRFSFRDLFEVVLTRDTWMHRLDVARATGRPFEITPEHDGAIVADAVREWAARHGRPFRLRLGGPAGGAFTNDADADLIQLDALEFMRTLSGRTHATGLLAQRIVF